MTDKQGILIGQYQGKYLNFTGQQFVLLSAPTRGGKGVSMVIPNLLSFQDSAVVLDIKQENYNITSGYRKKYGQAIYLFNPFTEDNRTDRYNQLDYVRKGVFMVGDLTSIGQIFYPTGGKDAFFDDQARNLFVGLGLYAKEYPDTFFYCVGLCNVKTNLSNKIINSDNTENLKHSKDLKIELLMTIYT